MERVCIDDKVLNALLEMDTLGSLVGMIEFFTEYPGGITGENVSTLMDYARRSGLPFVSYLEGFTIALGVVHKAADANGIPHCSEHDAKGERESVVNVVYDSFKMTGSVEDSINASLVGSLRNHTLSCPDCLDRYGAFFEKNQAFYSSLEHKARLDADILEIFGDTGLS